MKIHEAIKLTGSVNKSGLAKALGVSKQAVSQWPDVIRDDVADRVIGVAARLGRFDEINAYIKEARGEAA